MVELRNAEHREGVWMRPANLPRGSAKEARLVATAQAEQFNATPHEDGAALAATLWDLDAWVAHGQALLDATSFLRGDVARGVDSALAPTFLVLVAIVHHLDADPLLPTALLPRDWPGQALRAGFTDLEVAWQQLLASWRRSLRRR